MKKLTALLLALICSLAACGTDPELPVADLPTDSPVTNTPAEPTADNPPAEPTANGNPVWITYAEFLAAPTDAVVTVITNIQDVTERQDGKIQLYTQDADGAYYIDSLACTEEEAFGVLNPGARILVTGRKTESAGQIMITDATFALVESVSDKNFVAPVDVTELATQGADALAEKMNFWVTFKGLTVVPFVDAAGQDVPFLYGPDGSGTQGDDIYLRASIGEQTYTFLVNTSMLGTGPQSEQYESIEETLQIGAVITIECYLCWNDGPQPHVTALYPAA